MKKARLILTASMLTIAGFSAVTFTSCTKDDKVCPVGYEGSDCKTLSRDKFVGQWKGTEECTQGTDEYTITITKSSSSEIQLVYTNVYNDGYTATGTMTGSNGFTFSGTGIESGTGTAVTFNGTAALNSSTGQMTVDYTISGGTSSFSCTFKGTKL